MITTEAFYIGLSIIGVILLTVLAAIITKKWMRRKVLRISKVSLNDPKNGTLQNAAAVCYTKQMRISTMRTIFMACIKTQWPSKALCHWLHNTITIYHHVRVFLISRMIFLSISHGIPTCQWCWVECLAHLYIVSLIGNTVLIFYTKIKTKQNKIKAAIEKKKNHLLRKDSWTDRRHLSSNIQSDDVA